MLGKDEMVRRPHTHAMPDGFISQVLVRNLRIDGRSDRPTLQLERQRQLPLKLDNSLLGVVLLD